MQKAADIQDAISEGVSLSSVACLRDPPPLSGPISDAVRLLGAFLSHAAIASPLTWRRPRLSGSQHATAMGSRPSASRRATCKGVRQCPCVPECVRLPHDSPRPQQACTQMLTCTQSDASSWWRAVMLSCIRTHGIWMITGGVVPHHGVHLHGRLHGAHELAMFQVPHAACTCPVNARADSSSAGQRDLRIRMILHDRFETDKHGP